MYRNDGMTWALLAKCEPAALQEALDTYYAEVESWAPHIPRMFELSGGDAGWCVAYSRDRDQIHTEVALARRVSRSLGVPAFGLSYCDEDYAIAGAREFRDGVDVELHEVDYDEFLARHGCSLPPDTAPEPFQEPRSITVAVFEGGDLGEIRGYLERQHPTRAPIRMERTAKGAAMLRWPSGVGSSWLGVVLELRQPPSNLYVVTRYLDRAEWDVALATRRGSVWLGDAPYGADPEDYTPSIKGASTPEGVIDALGIPREALGLP